MSIVLYTNSTIKGKEDFVRFLQYEDFPAYLEARQDTLSDEEVKQVVDRLKNRDIRFDDNLPDLMQDKEEESGSLNYVENVSGGEMT